MNRWTNKSVIFIIVATIILAPVHFSALAQDQGAYVYQESYEDQKVAGGHMLADFFLLRPVGIVATGVGTVVFVVSLPFSVPGGNVGESFRKLIVKPAKFTFYRPLGRVDDYWYQEP